jgi:hypothetical protein
MTFGEDGWHTGADIAQGSGPAQGLDTWQAAGAW